MEVFEFEVLRIKHYSGNQGILLIGEGDFSFAVFLSRGFGSANNMVATTPETRDSLIRKHSKAMSNVNELKINGGIILYEVDVLKLSQHPFLRYCRFDRIVYNFPDAGPFSSEQNKFQIRLQHQELVMGYFKNARKLLTRTGEIHVTQRTTFPFREWKIEQLAEQSGLYLAHEQKFSRWDYPGYETIPVGPCSTFKFAKLFLPFTTSHFHTDDWIRTCGLDSRIGGPQMHNVIQVKEKIPDVELLDSFGNEKWIKHYSSNQRILLVGEGDFSFSLCLARKFRSGRHMTATSLDSKDDLFKYSRATRNVMELESRGCKIMHGVDVHTMLHHPQLMNEQFDRIVYNFPHAGYSKRGRGTSEYWEYQILLHQNLLTGFFKSAKEMLTRSGEIHVTHKTTFPFNSWEIVELAQELELFLVQEQEFSILDYPGYRNKRGDGNCDETFPVGESSTFMFARRLSSRTRFHPGVLSISIWSADTVNMACTYLDSLDNKKPKKVHKAKRSEPRIDG